MREVNEMNWLTAFETYKTAFLKDLEGLIAIPSTKDIDSVTTGAPFGKACRDALDYMLALGASYGFEVHNYEGYAGVIAYGEGTESVGLLAHLDVVPKGEGWTKEAFALTSEDGYLFGRGVLDDKGAALAGLYALRMLRDHHITCPKKILLIYGCDEESGSVCMKYYREHGEIPVCGFTPDADFPVIYGEKGGMHVHFKGACHTIIQSMHAGERANIVIGKASARLRAWDAQKAEMFAFYLKSHALHGSYEQDEQGVTIHMDGTFAHAAQPYNGVNAALHIMNFVGSAFNDVFAQKTYALLHDWQGKGLDIALDGAYMGFLTLNTGILHIAEQRAEIVLDIRYPNDTNAEMIYAKIKQKAEAIAYTLEVELVDDSKPLFVDPQKNLVQTLQSAYQQYSGDTFTPPLTIGGGTYARAFDNFLAFGPHFPQTNDQDDICVGGCHQRDEGMKANDLYCAIAIYTQALAELAGANNENA